MPIPPANPVASATGGTAPPKTDPNKKATFAGGDFQTFLKMLTTQIKNQDPLNPMEGSDFAVQLATFSGVEQQVQTNELLKKMALSQGGGAASAAQWIGKEVLSDAPVLYSGRPVALNVTAPAETERLNLIVTDATGKVVARQDVSPLGGTVTWDGLDATGLPLPVGLYSLRYAAQKGGEVLGSGKVAAYAPVQAVRQDPNGWRLILSSGAEINESAVTAIRAAS